MGAMVKNGSYGETFSPRDCDSPIAGTAACYRSGYRHPSGSNLRQFHFYRTFHFLASLQEVDLTLTVPITVATATPPRPTKADPEDIESILVFVVRAQ